MWTLLASTLALAGVLDTSVPAGTPEPGGMPAEVVAIARAVRDQPLGDRMEAVSRPLLGRPYALDPLGEGAGLDADPLSRYDIFDCQTFVEEVLALSLAADPLGAAEIRDQLRYGAGPRDYVHRHHFMELQWIPNAIESGWLRDSTADYGATTRLEKEVSAATWTAWGPRSRFAHTNNELPIGTMRLEVLSLDDAITAAERIKPGTLLLTVREDRSWSPIWVSHIGFIVPSTDHPTVRHATKLGSGGTRDHSLTWYLEHLKSYSRLRAIGVSLLEPREQGPRLSRISP